MLIRITNPIGINTSTFIDNAINEVNNDTHKMEHYENIPKRNLIWPDGDRLNIEFTNTEDGCAIYKLLQ
jgi:hypothetical protein